MATNSEDGWDQGEVFGLLSNHRRRYTIHFCKGSADPVTLSDLAEQIAAWEQEKSIEELDWSERKRVYTSLQQTHLPALEDAGMISQEDGEIELTDRAQRLEVYLDIVPGESISWGSYYLGLSVVGFGILGGVWAEILPTDPVPAVGWAALVVGIFAVSAAVHLHQNRKYRIGDMEHPP